MANVRAWENACATGSGSAVTRGSLEWSVPNTHDVGTPALSSRHNRPWANGSDAAQGAANAMMSASAVPHSAAHVTHPLVLFRGSSGEQAFGIRPRDRPHDVRGQLG